MPSPYSPPPVARQKQPAFARMSASGFNAMLLAQQAASHNGARPPRGSRAPGRKDPEEDLQRACFNWIFLHENRYPILRSVMHVPNGGKRTKAQAGRFKAMGVRKGVVDVICQFAAPGGKGLALELKAGKGRLSPEQSDYLALAAANGCITGVCYTLDEFIGLVRKYLGVGH